jgi:hypothetical protein
MGSDLLIFLAFCCCPIMCLCILSSVLWCPLRFPHNNDVRFVFTSSCLYVGSCLIYVICVCWRIVVSNTYNVRMCICFSCHRLVYHMLPVSMDCPFFIASSVFSNVYFLVSSQYSLTLLLYCPFLCCCSL